MKLCACPAPLRSTAELERLRCLRCAGWTPHGRLPAPDHAAQLAREAASLATKIADDYAWVHSVAHQPTRRPQNGRSAERSDPTGNQATDPARLTSRTYGLVTARLLERAVKALRSADEAVGDALLAAEPPGPKDHTPAPFHDPTSLYPGRPDLAAAHAAKTRREGRGEGTPT